jgi:hypothetical protein
MERPRKTLILLGFRLMAERKGFEPSVPLDVWRLDSELVRPIDICIFQRHNQISNRASRASDDR